MARTEEQLANGNARREIIENAQVQCYLARSECLRLKSQYGDVPEEYLREFQNAIVDYYWALRPLRSKGRVKETWDEVELAEDWRDPEKDEPISGLDTIRLLDELTETDTIERSSIRGTVRETITRQRVLPFSILKSISGKLDDAAGQLGFIPDPPDDKRLPMITEFDQSGEEPTAEIRNAEYHRSPEI